MAKDQGVNVTANIRGEDGKIASTKEAQVTYTFPETTAEAVKMFGEAVVLSKITQQVVIDLQGVLRRRLGKGQTQDQLQAYVENINAGNAEAPVQAWKPGVSAAKTSKTDRMLGDFAKLSPEAQAEFLKKMKAARA